mmetsp:Transcript_19291/g.54972  ORF Transcript_19291/g.54972 Transcript_19291/m.54972 type:complete len:222 (-) Transcript_19291:63-728(-)
MASASKPLRKPTRGTPTFSPMTPFSKRPLDGSSPKKRVPSKTFDVASPTSMRLTSSWLQCPNRPNSGMLGSSMSSWTAGKVLESRTEQRKLRTPSGPPSHELKASSKMCWTSEARETLRLTTVRAAAPVATAEAHALLSSSLLPAIETSQTTYDDDGVAWNMTEANAFASTAARKSSSPSEHAIGSSPRPGGAAPSASAKSNDLTMKACTGAKMPQGPPRL